jgi:ferredoxin--NADP+ reductase
MSIIQDPETYERFEKVVVVHGVRRVSDLAYRQFIEETLPRHELLGELVEGKLIYHPTVTREPFRTQGRLTDQIREGSLAEMVDLPPLDPSADRFMLCGSPGMLEDTRRLLDEKGFVVSPRIGEPGDYVIERAFVEK